VSSCTLSNLSLSPLGFSGRFCEQNVNDCSRVTCLNGGTCVDGVNAFQCVCAQPFTGFYCESEVSPFRDNPWKACNSAAFCYERFGDGHCDPDCNSKACLFDGMDCRFPSASGAADRNCNEMYESYCAANYANGRCDSGCNNAECAWDGLDCEPAAHEVDAAGELIIQLDAPFALLTQSTAESRETLSSLLRALSTVIGSVVKLRQLKQNGTHSTQLVLSVDNRRCAADQCFDSSRQIASFLSAAKNKDGDRFASLLHSGFKITDIDATDDDRLEGDVTRDSPHGLTYVAVAVVILLVGGAFVGVLVTTNRKKVAKGITWFPEGFFNASMTGHSARDRHMANASASAASGEYGRARRRTTGGARTGRPDGQEMRQFKSREDLMDDKTAIYEEPMECRKWTNAHFDAYNAYGTEAMTPPLNTPSIDAIGPNGMTPLMVASAFPHHVITIDNPDVVSADNNAVHDLLMNGANVGMTCDRTHETSLHLAARYARADAAKRLLDSGADCNATDATGRTPLHTAIASDARGVFEILLRNRQTNLNARASDGTTPLILAARLANEGMLEQLVMSECDLNAADDCGKTALHWAASVNNYDAVRVLLQNGANRDAQNNREETPLFLAAREGAFQCARLLLESNANRDITDHMDRLPRDVALERMHTDIVGLLDEFVPPMPTPAAHNAPISPKQHSLRRKQSQARAVPPLPPPRNQMTSQQIYELSPPLVSPPSRPPPTYEDSLTFKQRQMLQQPPLMTQWPQTGVQVNPRPPESYLTPSPDSPNTWISSPSTSSPISAHDWLSLQTTDATTTVVQQSSVQSPSGARFAPSSTQQAVFI
jgi:Notch-like protein